MPHLRFETPLGGMIAFAEGDALTRLSFGDEHNGPPQPGTADDPEHSVLQRTRKQVLEYFAGTRPDFDLPLAPSGNRFQHTVWTALGHLRAGQTLSYGELAQRLDRPQAVRAVAQAVARNPLILVVPCHRVVGVRGALTGYAAGLERKRVLLAHERQSYRPRPVACPASPS